MGIARLAGIGIGATLAASGGVGGARSTPAMPMPPPSIAIAIPGLAVLKVQSGTGGFAVIRQHLTALTEPGPDRSVAIYDVRRLATGQHAAPAGSSLIDFAQHGSGELSVAIATAKE